MSVSGMQLSACASPKTSVGIGRGAWSRLLKTVNEKLQTPVFGEVGTHSLRVVAPTFPPLEHGGFSFHGEAVNISSASVRMIAGAGLLLPPPLSKDREKHTLSTTGFRSPSRDRKPVGRPSRSNDPEGNQSRR